MIDLGYVVAVLKAHREQLAPVLPGASGTSDRAFSPESNFDRDGAELLFRDAIRYRVAAPAAILALVAR